jgi:1-aminocyclopropane-1-carboxylate deaminase/D-cysteine desulfhydrase-like pyridoxal-dependent ACC family enzyme
MADVLTSGAEVVVTCGATQSNFVRQLGAACRCFGVGCTAVVMTLPYDSIRLPAPSRNTDAGNMRLGQIVGVEYEFLPDGTWEELYSAAEDCASTLEGAGRRVYRMPIGGSSPLGAYGFVEAARELDEQAPPFDQIVFASSSGSTHVGLAYAFADRETRILGIACDPEPDIAEDFARLGEGLVDLLGVGKRLRADEFHLDFRFVGPGYGVPGEQGDAAIARLASTEGIFLDPIYTGKAFAGLLALAQEGALPGRTLFWHTGGLPALFT